MNSNHKTLPLRRNLSPRVRANALFFAWLVPCAVMVISQLCELGVKAGLAADAPQTTSPTNEDISETSATAQSVGTGFEEFQAGDLGMQSDRSGTWTAKPGDAVVHTKHQRSGKQSLRLLGGSNRTVQWTVANTPSGADTLELWFERWTSRHPFDFRIEAMVEGEWQTIHHDTEAAVVGSFRNHLTLNLPTPSSKAFRFTSHTPANTGVMIDDVSLSKAGPMAISSVDVVQAISPVLIGNKINPILDVQVQTIGRKKPIAVSELRIELTGTTDLADIEYVEVLATAGSPPDWRDIESETNSLKRLGQKQEPALEMAFAGKALLEPGANHFFVSVALKPTASLDHQICLQCNAIVADRERPIPTEKVATSQRIGVAVRKSNDDQSKAFRIPGLVTTNQGTLIAVYDVRYRGWGDLPNDIDVGMSRSTDGGQSWEPMKILMDMGNDPKWRYDGVGDPAVLIDEKSGTIWVAATWSHGNRSWVGSGPGLTPEETGQLMLVRSDDDGVTWSKPINITSQIKDPAWSFILQGPGRGITMSDGTLVFPAQYQDPPDRKRTPHSTIIFSKDHGETWHCGSGAFRDTTESAVVEIEPGVLMLNCRYDKSNRRVVMITRDMGKTWQEHPTSRKSLPEPRACMASLIRTPGLSTSTGISPWLLFSNPNRDVGPRSHMSIKASRDKGMTWPSHWHTLIDEGASAGYSCLTMVDSERVGLLFEGSRAHMAFVRIPLADLTQVPLEFRSKGKTGSRLKLASVFQDHMVLQAGSELAVWGTAEPNELVQVDFNGSKTDAQSDESGNWSTLLPAMPPSAAPKTLVVKTFSEKVQISDVLVGEVWLAAGQSNMEWPLIQTVNAQTAIASADDGNLRLLYMRGAARGGAGNYTKEELRRLAPDRFCRGTWHTSSSDSARDFSAVGYHFARRLRAELDVPVGIICSAIGGTPTEAWVRRHALASDPKLRRLVDGNWLENELINEWARDRASANLASASRAGHFIPGDDIGPNHSFKPSFMWDSGIEPLIPFGIRGVLWYQGETNAESADGVALHDRIFPLLVRDWRDQWQRSDLPFLFVQLPAMNRPHWPHFRNQQRRFLKSINHTGMATTIDTGARNNVHPTDKRVVGERLARWALGKIYKSPKFTTYSGPLFRKAVFQLNKVVLHFNHVGQGLKSNDGQPLRHFEVAGADGKFQPATASIDGRSVVLRSSEIGRPVAARYAWSPFPEPAVNFTNSSGLPASPFAISNVQEGDLENNSPSQTGY